MLFRKPTPTEIDFDLPRKDVRKLLLKITDEAAEGEEDVKQRMKNRGDFSASSMLKFANPKDSLRTFNGGNSHPAEI